MAPHFGQVISVHGTSLSCGIVYPQFGHMHSPPVPQPIGVKEGEGLGPGVTTVVGVEPGVGVDTGASSSMHPVNNAITTIATTATNPTTFFLFITFLYYLIIF